MSPAQYKEEMQKEMQDILQYWTDYAPDKVNGGFYGKIDNDDFPDATADKGAVLHTRILWAFSAGYGFTGEKEYLGAAQRAFDYIVHHFMDEVYGGLYWSLDYQGNVRDDKKQIYAQAFAIYAFSEYHTIVPGKRLKQKAIDLYSCIQQYSYDQENGGYVEAFTRQWKEIDDMRLSEKDANEKKTMNTHLHVLEAYTNLYRIWENDGLKADIIELMAIFYDKIMDRQRGHLQLFFDKRWRSKTDKVSYGHDIEASWLLLEAAAAVKEDLLVEKFKSLALQLVAAVLEGWDEEGGLWYEKEDGRVVKEKHWWVQAEAMVGLLNAYRLSGNKKYKELSYSAWAFVRRHIRMPKGEWLWGVDENRRPLPVPEKAGFWKCPYHNTRACIELIKRLES